MHDGSTQRGIKLAVQNVARRTSAGGDGKLGAEGPLNSRKCVDRVYF